MMCSKCPDDDWEFTGKDNVGINMINYIDTISVIDSLFLIIHGNTIRGDKFNNEELVIEREDFSILLTFYADIYKFVGCDVMPPTSLNPFSDFMVLPPFQPGHLRLIVKQPYGLDTIGVITVIPP